MLIGLHFAVDRWCADCWCRAPSRALSLQGLCTGKKLVRAFEACAKQFDACSRLLRWCANWRCTGVQLARPVFLQCGRTLGKPDLVAKLTGPRLATPSRGFDSRGRQVVWLAAWRAYGHWWMVWTAWWPAEQARLASRAEDMASIGWWWAGGRHGRRLGAADDVGDGMAVRSVLGRPQWSSVTIEAGPFKVCLNACGAGGCCAF